MHPQSMGAKMSLKEFVDFMGQKGVLHSCFYHFTDERNLPEIRQHGLLSMAAIRAKGLEVAAPGGNDWSWEADARVGMDRYVHLCFFNEHPMEYRAKEAGRLERTRFLQIDPGVLLRDGVRISLEVSNKAGAKILPVEEALDSLDFEVIYTRTDWKDAAVKDRLKIARLYEVLVPDGVPVEYIKNLT